MGEQVAARILELMVIGGAVSGADGMIPSRSRRDGVM